MWASSETRHILLPTCTRDTAGSNLSMSVRYPDFGYLVSYQSLPVYSGVVCQISLSTVTGERCLSSPKRLNLLWGPPSLLFHGNRRFLPGVKWPGREADHSPQPRAKDTNDWNHNHAPHNDVSVNDGPHIRRWSHMIVILQYNIIILTIVLQLPTVFSTVTCCTGL